MQGPWRAGGLSALLLFMAFSAAAADRTLDPQKLARALSLSRFTAQDRLGPPFGPPQEGRLQQAAGRDREAGVQAKATLPMDGPGNHSGIEYWVFATPDQARAALADEASQRTLLVPPGLGRTPGNPPAFAGLDVDGYSEVICGRTRIAPSVPARYLRCWHQPDGSQAVIVVYHNGTEPPGGDAALVAAALGLAQRKLTEAEGAKPLPVPTGAAILDPHLIGTWESAAANPRLTLKIVNDGSYVFQQDGVTSHSGRISARVGGWAMSAQGQDWRGQGFYEMPDLDTLIWKGGSGPITFRRVGD
jgi:hypothetical protein